MNYIKAVLLIGLSFLLAACESTETKILKVGISPWPGYEPLALAAQMGFYDDTKVRIIRFATPTESYRALRDGIIDVAAFTADEVFHYAGVREKPRIFLVLDISNGADAIVARPDIKSLSDLKGKRIGLEGSALGDYMINRALDFTQGVKISDMKLIPIKINLQTQAYLINEVDAVVTYEPSKSMLINAGAHIIFDSSQIPAEVVDVLVTNEITVQTRPQELTALATGWFKVVAHINDNYEQCMQNMSLNEATNTQEFQRGYEDLIIPSKEQNLKMLGHNGSLLEPMQKLSKLMFSKGSLTNEIDVRPLLTNTILERMEE